jgi:hypothetical protein
MGHIGKLELQLPDHHDSDGWTEFIADQLRPVRPLLFVVLPVKIKLIVIRSDLSPGL